MIRRLHIAILRRLAAHHNRMTQSLGAAVLDAQQRQAWDDVGAVWKKREHHRQRRDLLTLKASALEYTHQRHYSTDPELLRQCADQMSAKQFVHHHHAGDLRR